MLTTNQVAALREDSDKPELVEFWCQSFSEDATEIRNIAGATVARRWCRKHGYTTRKASHHIIDGRDNPELWQRLTWTGAADGVSWKLVKVDQIRNIYLQF